MSMTKIDYFSVMLIESEIGVNEIIVTASKMKRRLQQFYRGMQIDPLFQSPLHIPVSL
jgi:hypothetical protein